MSETAKLVPVTVELDRPRRLFVDLNALDLAEQKTGRNLLDPTSWHGLKAGDIKILVWAFLLRDDPDLKLEEVGALLHPANTRQVLNKALESIHLSLPPREAQEGQDEEKEGDDPLTAGP